MAWTMTYREKQEEKRLNREFRQKYAPKKQYLKSKKQRQAWWNNLSDEDRAAYLERVQEKKAEKRQARSIKLMTGKHYDCKLCIHGKTHSCTDNLPTGCEYYSNASIKAEIRQTA